MSTCTSTVCYALAETTLTDSTSINIITFRTDAINITKPIQAVILGILSHLGLTLVSASIQNGTLTIVYQGVPLVDDS
jgi:hypothetical protein